MAVLGNEHTYKAKHSLHFMLSGRDIASFGQLYLISKAHI